MAGLADIQDNAEFQGLSPEAKTIVVDKLSANDAGYSALSPEAQGIVRSKLIGTSVSQQPRESSIKEPTAPAPLGPHLFDAAKKGFAGALSIPGLLVDAANLPFRGLTALSGGAIPSSENPTFGMQDLYTRNAALLGVKNTPVPTDPYGNPSRANQYLSKAAEFGGAAALPAAVVVGAAANPLVAALVEIAGTGIAAMSAVELRKIAEDNAQRLGVSKETAGHLGEFVGSLAGPAAVGKVGQLAEKGTTFARGKIGVEGGISESAQKNAAQALASDQLRKSLEASLLSQQNMQTAVGLQDKIPGFNPTLGAASNAPGIVALEQKISGSTPQTLARATERKISNDAAISSFKDSAFPVPAQPITAGPKTTYSRIADVFDKRLDNVNSEIKSLASKSEFQDNAAIGDRLRGLRDEAQKSARGVKNALYDDVYEAAKSAGIKSDVADVKSLMIEVAGSDANAAQTMPSLYGQLKRAMDKYTPEERKVLLADGTPQPRANTEVPFEALHSMLKEANKDVSRAYLANDPTRAYLSGQVRDLLESKVKAFEGAEYGNVGEKLRSANEYFATKYKPTFYEGVGGRMAYGNRFGEVTKDEDIVRNLVFKQNGQKGLADFFEIYGANPEAKQLLKDGVTDIFAKQVVRDGEIRPTAVESFMRQHASQLNAMPDIKNELSNINTANNLLLARRAALEQQKKTLDSSVLAKLANSESADEAIKRAISDPKAMQVLLANAARNPWAKDAVASSIARHIADQPNSFQYIADNAPFLRRSLETLGKGHFDNLLILTNAREVSGRIHVPTNVGSIETVQDLGTKVIGTPIKGILANLRNWSRGYQSPEYVFADLGGRYIYKIRTEEANKLLDAAIYDPALARTLVNMKQGAVTKSDLNDLRNHAFAHGVKVVAVDKESNQSQQNERQTQPQRPDPRIPFDAPNQPQYPVPR